MEEIYDQIGNYVTTCIDDKKTLEILVEELLPLLKQVNYAALSVDELEQTNSTLGLGDQAAVITSNIVSIYKMNTGKDAASLMSVAGVDPRVIKVVMEDLTYSWIPAGLLLLGSGVLTRLREILDGDVKQ